jgi:hypothetical protein
MSAESFSSGSDERPIGPDWKAYWRLRERQDPEKRRETRQEKRAARRRIHQSRRRQIKNQLKNWEAQ